MAEEENITAEKKPSLRLQEKFAPILLTVLLVGMAAAVFLTSYLSVPPLSVQSVSYASVSAVPVGYVSTEETTVPETTVSLNTATAEELMTLPGIGEVTAEAILSYRDAHGAFTSFSELLEVDGIGEATYEALLPYLILDGESAVETVDLNTADTDTLMTLPGMTEEIAAILTENRPYSWKEEILKLDGIDEDLLREWDGRYTLGEYQSDEPYDPFPLDLNQATLEELMLLPGIGEATAQKILDYREEAGRFSRVDELMRVNGIGDKKYAEIKDYLFVSEQEESSAETADSTEETETSSSVSE